MSVIIYPQNSSLLLYKKQQRVQKRQQGAILVTSLIFLVVLTVLGLSGARTSLLEEKMSANFKDKNLAFQAAETALRAGENWMAAQSLVPEQDNSRVYQLNANDTTDKNWWWPNDSDIDVDNNGIPINIGLVNKSPRYIIEKQLFIPDSLNVGHSNPSGQYIHRVTAFSVGGTNNTSSLLQSTYLKRYNE
ncbi:MAG: pilus assembly protein PilX [Gammaproteobacteria bacterium]|nr:pilus assembly protein PilX [Gammaproteobacteria bacterium]